MLSTNKENTIDEVEALQFLRDSVDPEIEEAEFKSRWLGAFISEDAQKFYKPWVQMVSKSPSQSVRIMRNGVEVARVPPLLGSWPTETPPNVRQSMSELVASSNIESARIPALGQTQLRNGLAQQFDRVANSDTVKQIKHNLRDQWVALFKFYGVEGVGGPTVNGTEPNQSESTAGLFDSYEEF